jgi:hypothetical protein
VATGKVSGRQYKRRRRIEFLDLMNRIVAEHSGREIHVILDNLDTHKSKNDRWLKRHASARVLAWGNLAQVVARSFRTGRAMRRAIAAAILQRGGKSRKMGEVRACSSWGCE